MDEDLKALQQTLKAAAESKSTAHIGHKECERGAASIERVQQAVDDAFDKNAQRNAAENEKPTATAAGFVVEPTQSRRRTEDTVL